MKNNGNERNDRGMAQPTPWPVGPMAIRKQSVRYARKAWGGRSGCARSADVGAIRIAGTTRADRNAADTGATQVNVAPGLHGVHPVQLVPCAV